MVLCDYFAQTVGKCPIKRSYLLLANSNQMLKLQNMLRIHQSFCSIFLICLMLRRWSAMVPINVDPEMHVKHSLVVTRCTLMSRRYICCIWTNMKQMPRLMAQLNSALSVAFQTTQNQATQRAKLIFLVWPQQGTWMADRRAGYGHSWSGDAVSS